MSYPRYTAKPDLKQEGAKLMRPPPLLSQRFKWSRTTFEISTYPYSIFSYWLLVIGIYNFYILRGARNRLVLQFLFFSFCVYTDQNYFFFFLIWTKESAGISRLYFWRGGGLKISWHRKKHGNIHETCFLNCSISIWRYKNKGMIKMTSNPD